MIVDMFDVIMRKVFCIFAGIVMVLPAFADVTPSTKVASTSYVQGAYNTMDSAKQDTLTSTNVVTSGSGAMVTNVTAADGTVTVTKSDVTIPVGSADSSTRARIWIQ